MKRSWAVIGGTLSVILGVGVGVAQDGQSGSEAQRETGRRVYEKMCAQCHGEKGDGHGIANPYFRPAPRDFTQGLFKIRTTESGALPTHEDLKAVIRKGMPYTGMPAWPGLSEEELDGVAYFLETFTTDFADPDLKPTPIQIPKAPGFSKESAALGVKLFEENKCGDCHGVHGRGNGKSAPTLKDEWGAPIRPADLTKRWTFRGGSSREDIYRTFTTGLNGTPMPSYADLIAEEDRWHLVDYVYSLSKDEPEYSTHVTATGVEGAIDPANLEARFESAPSAFFPVFGQVVEPGRNFHPGATAIEVKAVYDDDEILFRLAWNDMTADTMGSNLPAMEVAEVHGGADTTGPGTFSDAVAVQIPSTSVTGAARPYFLFGDVGKPVDILFADLAGTHGERFVGRGSRNLERVGESIPVEAVYDDGQWRVTFRHPRHPADALSFDEGTFVPVAFSVWDGRSGERGNRRVVTSWYHVYVTPLRSPSKTMPAATYAFVIILVEFAVVHLARRKHGVKAPKWLTPHVPDGIDLGFSMLGGLVATMAMTVFLYFVMPTLLHEPMNIAVLMDEVFDGIWALGVSIHFVLGALIFPLVFVEFFYERVPGPAWLRGLAWGALLWVVAEMVAIPIAKGGVFHSHAGGLRGAFGFLLGHLIYGAVLGAVTQSSGPDREEPLRST